MNEARRSRSAERDELFLLHRVERFNLLLLALLTAGSYSIVDRPFAQSVLLGGALVSGSFFWLKRSALRFVHHVEAAGEQINGKSLSTGFAIKFAIRLFVLAFLLLFLNIRFSINVIGLTLGLSTVMISVIIVVLFQGRMIFLKNM